MTSAADADVVVVGAGPTGLMATLCLLRMGVSVVLVDVKDGPTRESRALALQARSMEIFDQLGLRNEILEQATPAPAIVPGYRDRTFRPVEFGPMGRRLTPFPGVYVLEQSRTEALLGEALRRAGGAIRWGHRVTGMSDEADRIRLRLVDRDGAASEIVARWCVGADGSGSTVRELAGIEFDGHTSPMHFFVADAVGVTGLAENRVNMRVSERDFLLTFPMAGLQHHRLLGVLDSPTGDLRAAMQATLANQFEVRFESLDWFSNYRVHHRVARRFKAGRVFLAGDSAHVHSPVGAQGMNTGLQDAHNLAAKIADVVRLRAGPSLLDEYERERRPVAVRLVRVTDAAFSRITSQSRLARAVRRRLVPAVAPVAVRIVPRLVGTDRLYGYLSQTRIRYPVARRSSKWTGRRLPWTGTNFDALRGLDWQVHGYGAEPAAIAEHAARLGAQAKNFAPDPHRRLRRDRAYVVRPDGFLIDEIAVGP